jgi:hypothetical protein
MALIFASRTGYTLRRVGPKCSKSIFATGRTARRSQETQKSSSAEAKINTQYQSQVCSKWELLPYIEGSDQTSADRVSLPLAHTTLEQIGMTECQTGRFLVLIVGDLKAKHTDCNPRLTTAKVPLLCDRDNKTSCLNYRLDSPTTVRYSHNATANVLDTTVVKVFVLQARVFVQHSLRITCLF